MDFPEIKLYGKDDKGHFYRLPYPYRRPWYWRIRALWRGVGALFSFRGRFWWAEEDE